MFYTMSVVALSVDDSKAYLQTGGHATSTIGVREADARAAERKTGIAWAERTRRINLFPKASTLLPRCNKQDSLPSNCEVRIAVFSLPL